jgi:hypothetical protein
VHIRLIFIAAIETSVLASRPFDIEETPLNSEAIKRYLRFDRFIEISNSLKIATLALRLAMRMNGAIFTRVNCWPSAFREIAVGRRREMLTAL